MYDFPHSTMTDTTDEISEVKPLGIEGYLEDRDRESTHSYKQVLTHQVIHATFYTYQLKSKFDSRFTWVTKSDFLDIPLSGIVRLYLAENMHIFNHTN